MRSLPLLLSFCFAGVLLERPASAAELEPVRLVVDDASGCVDEPLLRADIAELGGAFRDANLDDRARTFRIEVTRTTAQVTGRLVVHDLAFRPHIREVTGADCAKLSRTLALFVATALDERVAPPPEEPPPVTAAPTLWPAPAADPDAATREPPPLGSGGIAATAFASGMTSDTTSEGIRFHGVARVIGTTRLGLTGASARESRDVFGKHVKEASRGASTRAGAVIGWGAPWNDSVVGFSAEAGVAWGEHRGQRTPLLPAGLSSSSVVCGHSRCVSLDVRNAASKRWSFVSPYVASQVVLQIPHRKLPVRPMLAIGALWVPIAAGGGSFATTIEGGLAWQAW